MSNNATSAPEAGQTLAGKYRVEEVLGVGGMGVVVAATHLQLEQKVAIKFLLPAALLNPEVVERFAREARAAAKIRSEHVARVIDVGQLDDGAPYMVMEHLEGHDLAKHLELHGPLPVEDAVHFVLQACEALAEAHVGGSSIAISSRRTCSCRRSPTRAPSSRCSTSASRRPATRPALR